MTVRHLHHVQLAMPKGGEDHARRFYAGLLDIPEVPKPHPLAARAGCWFERDGLRVHLGVEEYHRPARKAHPAFVVDGLEELAEELRRNGFPVVEDEQLEGFRRVYADDPFGNRIELMEAVEEADG